MAREADDVTSFASVKTVETYVSVEDDDQDSEREVPAAWQCPEGQLKAAPSDTPGLIAVRLSTVNPQQIVVLTRTWL